MADQPAHRHVEVSDGKRVVASAQVTTSPEDPGTAQASLQAESGHLPAGAGRSLVDAVPIRPNCKAATPRSDGPLGDAESPTAEKN
jgi:hypothetical protein